MEIERPLGLTIIRGGNVVGIREEKSPQGFREMRAMEEMEGPGKTQVEIV